MTTDSRPVPSDPDERHLLASKKSVVQELERHGYLAEPQSVGSTQGTIYRHPAAPSLFVSDDGRIEVLSHQPDTEGRLLSQPRQKQIHRGRALLVVALLCAATFVGLLVVAMIAG
jgi:hypothetical protein